MRLDVIHAGTSKPVTFWRAGSTSAQRRGPCRKPRALTLTAVERRKVDGRTMIYPSAGSLGALTPFGVAEQALVIRP